MMCWCENCAKFINIPYKRLTRFQVPVQIPQEKCDSVPQENCIQIPQQVPRKICYGGYGGGGGGGFGGKGHH